MSAAILILALIIVLFLFSRKNNSVNTQTTFNNNVNLKKYIAANKEDHLTDENGQKYYTIQRTRKNVRKLYIHGFLTGKYRGDLDTDKQNRFLNSKFFNFDIYESEIDTIELNSCNCITESKSLCNGIHTEMEGGFLLDSDEVGDSIIKYNKPIPAILSIKSLGEKFNISIREPELKNIQIDKKLHQTEEHEVFGTLKAEIKGYIFEEENEEYFDRIYVDDKGEVIEDSLPLNSGTPSDYIPSRVSNDDCCLSSILRWLLLIIGILFLISAFPVLLSLWPLFLFLLLYFLLRDNLGCIIPVILLLLAGIFIFSILTSNNPLRRRYVYPPKEEQDRRKSDNIPITDTVKSNDPTRFDSLIQDTLIMHYQTWKDYNGNRYEGRYWVKQRDYNNVHNYKTSLDITGMDDLDAYNKMLFSLKEFDKNKLSGIYYMFDSLKQANNFDTSQFASVIVSFVQHIPYVLILPFDCDPSLYRNDIFAVHYLSRPDARCSGNQKFGINSPVEFMANSNADCDSRTLFLYTILAHYGYDVALMSSEYYNHSVIGINLPFNGLTYDYYNQHYVLWETTDKGWKPGILGAENNDITKWRISLKSK